MPQGRTVSNEISHLIRDKGMSQRQAVAASLEQARRGKLGTKRDRAYARRGR